MSRIAHFGIALAILTICVLWCVFGVFMFFALAAGRDSRGGTIYDSAFIVLYLIFGAGFFVGLWFAFRSFRSALRPSRPVSQIETGQAPDATKQQDALATPDERLAHLVKESQT